MVERRLPYREAHLKLLMNEKACLLGGAMGDAKSGMLLFTSKDACIKFADADPYVSEGLVLNKTIELWNTVAGTLHPPLSSSR